jgi:hypothetical protein
MSLAIETVRVSQELETITCKEVTCIFCGRPTPVPAWGPSGFASHVPRRISLVRCMVCGKEAPYRACDTFEFGEMYSARLSI